MRAATPTAASEERIENIPEATESAESAATETTGCAVLIACAIVIAALIRIREHLISVSDRFELLVRVLTRVQVRVELTGKLAVGALDFLFRSVLGYPQGFVVVSHDVNKSLSLAGLVV